MTTADWETRSGGVNTGGEKSCAAIGIFNRIKTKTMNTYFNHEPHQQHELIFLLVRDGS